MFSLLEIPGNISADKNRQRNDHDVLDDVLPDEVRNKKSFPREMRKDDEWTERGECMRHEHVERPFFFSGKKEKDSDHTFISAEKENENIPRKKPECVFIKRVHYSIGRAKFHNFQNSKPEEDDKESATRNRDADSPEISEELVLKRYSSFIENCKDALAQLKSV